MIKKLLCVLTISIFTISASAQIWSEGFEGGAIPSDWTNVSNATDGGWAVGTAGNSGSAPIPEHTNYAYTNDDACNCDKAGESLTTGSISIPADGVHLLSFDYWGVNGDYQGADETAIVSISSDGGTTFTEALNFEAGSNEWQTAQYILTDYAGMDIVLQFAYDDGGGWNYAFAIDDVAIGVLEAISAINNGVSLPEIYAISDGSVDVTIDVENAGSETITEFVYNYQVDGGDVVSETVTGVSIAPFESEVFVHSTAYTASAIGDKNVVAWISDINGSAELTAEADNTVQIVNESVAGFAMSETFTSNTCGPCAAFNPTYSVELDNLDANSPSTDILAIKYQVNWPAPGTDVCYNPDADAMVGYYGITGVPNTLIQGKDIEFVGTTWADAAVAAAATLPEFAAESGFIDMVVTSSLSGSTVDVNVTLTSKANFDAGLKLSVAIVNNEYAIGELPISGNNGETEFDRVMRKMLPDADGTTLPAMVIDEELSYDFSYETTVGSPAQTNYNLVNEDISIVATVQRVSDKKFWAAEAGDIATSLADLENVAGIAIYPNPVVDNATIAIDLKEALDIDVTVTNILGETMYTHNEGILPVGLNNIVIDTQSWTQGVYFFNIVSGNDVVSNKVIVNH